MGVGWGAGSADAGMYGGAVNFHLWMQKQSNPPELDKSLAFECVGLAFECDCR